MTTFPFEDMTDGQILRQLYKEFREANGRCREHAVALFGDPAQQKVGIKDQVIKHEVYIVRQKAGWRVIYGLVGAIGVSNIALLIHWLAGG